MTQTLRRALERLYPALDSFFHPTNSVDGPTVIWLSSSLLFILATLCILLKHDAKDLEKGHAKHSSVLQPTSGQKRSPRYSPIPASTQALLTLLTPTKASRSTEYMPILHELISCLCLHSKVIFLDFTKVVQAICDDSELEFRNPSNFSIGAALGDEDDNDGGDLKHLFTQDFVSYGWKIVVVPSFWLSCKVMIWILESYTLDWRFLNPTEGLIGGRDWVGATAYTRASSMTSHSQGYRPKKQVTFELPRTNPGLPSSLNIHHERHSLYLDAIPKSKIPIAVRHFVLNLPRGTTGIIEFTTISSSVTFLSHNFVLLALILCHRDGKASQTDQATSAKPERTTPTVLFLSLPQVLQVLLDEIWAISSNVHLKAVFDTSRTVARSLQAQERALVEESSIRMAYIHKYDTGAWRRRRLFLSMEAGLLMAGLCAHWEIHVERT